MIFFTSSQINKDPFQKGYSQNVEDSQTGLDGFGLGQPLISKGKGQSLIKRAPKKHVIW